MFRQKKIAGLLEKEIFKIVTSEDVPSNTHIFDSHFVNKINNPGIDQVYEKSCFVIQAHNDKNKNLVLMQSPAI